MKKRTVLLLFVMIVVIIGAVMLPSVISNYQEKLLLSKIETMNGIVPTDSTETEVMTLDEKLMFINKETVVRSQIEGKESEAIRSALEAELVKCEEIDVLICDAKILLQELFLSASDISYKRNCYIDGQSFQYMFTDVVSFAFYSGWIQLEMEPDSEKLISFSFESYNMNMFGIDNFFSSAIVEKWPEYLYGIAEEKEEEYPMEIEMDEYGSYEEVDRGEYSFYDWYDYMITEGFSFAPYGDTYGDTYIAEYSRGYHYTFSFMIYDQKTGKYTTSWSPYMG